MNFYKKYGNAKKHFPHSRVEAVTLDNVDGFMPFYSIRPHKELKRDKFTCLTKIYRHLITAQTRAGLYGFYSFEGLCEANDPPLQMMQLLFTKEEEALAYHDRLVKSYRNNKKWSENE